VARYRVRQKVGLVGPALADSALLYARLRYGLDFSQASPADVVAGIHIPVLLIHSPADRNVPPEHSLLLATRNPRFVTLWAPPGVPHTATLAKLPAEFERRVIAHFRAAAP
jgi:pimeloyl-ACP methyl ester carboxylesterase